MKRAEYHRLTLHGPNTVHVCLVPCQHADEFRAELTRTLPLDWKVNNVMPVPADYLADEMKEHLTFADTPDANTLVELLATS